MFVAQIAGTIAFTATAIAMLTAESAVLPELLPLVVVDLDDDLCPLRPISPAAFPGSPCRDSVK